MLCEICNKNEATIHIQEIVGGKKKSLHLCSTCAAAKQHGAGMDIGPFDLAGLLYKLSGAEGAEAPENAPEKEEKDELVCPVCAWDAEKLKKSGRLGCGNCYKVFASLLTEPLKKMHRGGAHLGKQPVGKGTELFRCRQELAHLQQKLQQAIEVEDYESAAELRDQINELKKRCEDAAEN